MRDKHKRLRQPCLSEWGDLQVSRDTSKLWVVVSILKSVSGTEPPDTAARVYQGGEVSDIYWLNDLCHSHFDTSMDL